MEEASGAGNGDVSLGGGVGEVELLSRIADAMERGEFTLEQTNGQQRANGNRPIGRWRERALDLENRNQRRLGRYRVNRSPSFESDALEEYDSRISQFGLCLSRICCRLICLGVLAGVCRLLSEADSAGRHHH